MELGTILVRLPKGAPHFRLTRGFQVGSGDRGQQCLSEAAVPRIFQSGRTCVETSGDVIESTITSTAECRIWDFSPMR